MPQIVTPNLFHLHGNQLHMTYSTTGIDGRPHMTYQDAREAKSFQGDEIRAVTCDLGTLVSITLRMTIDVGSTSLSLFIPRMRITEGTSAAVHTHCVTTLHRFSTASPLDRGQLDTYTVTPAQGTARFVLF